MATRRKMTAMRGVTDGDVVAHMSGVSSWERGVVVDCSRLEGGWVSCGKSRDRNRRSWCFVAVRVCGLGEGEGDFSCGVCGV